MNRGYVARHRYQTMRTAWWVSLAIGWALALGGVIGSLVARANGKDWDDWVVITRGLAAPLQVAFTASLVCVAICLLLQVLAWRHLRRLRETMAALESNRDR